jgi:uncharacterized protein (DUF1330 family)
MAKGYWIVHIDVHDAEAYKKYVAVAPAAISAFGGVYLARGGAFETKEGGEIGPRHVVIEFPTYKAALDCYSSPAYQSALKLRQAASNGRFVITEGLA